MVVEYEESLEESSYSAAAYGPQDTARLAINAARKDDLADIMFLANNRRIAEMLSSMPHPFTLDDAKALVKRSEATRMGQALFAIRMKNTGRLIGAIGYGPLAEDGGTLHLGYWIGEPFWGQGYATEAAHAVVDFAFSNGGVNELTAACRVNNPGSRRVLEKSGFQFREQSKMRMSGNSGLVNVDRFSLTRSTWKALKAWGQAA
ncbi:GNAT family N-acetyltransferase [Pseudovibrio sp. SPO723]|uniref:GNAT family N-acetyltransferase n=1 Tax=Nesiotobacter zosterae TaxID=392721 RepID=UPI0029C3E7C4|nr:GNAT family N-acetyltransferase [Pseudovibrio sp. SPO723]MDX5592170.1 GNAT family N-acetyltransferase [Pseudovibrio sp. SPO723]